VDGTVCDALGELAQNDKLYTPIPAGHRNLRANKQNGPRDYQGFRSYGYKPWPYAVQNPGRPNQWIAGLKKKKGNVKADCPAFRANWPLNGLHPKGID